MIPRFELCDPSNVRDIPVPLHMLHYERVTYTSSSCADEKKVVDWWDDPARKDVHLSEQWVGKNTF